MSASKRYYRQAGAAMVEMAIVLSIFLMLMLGIVEFSMAYFSWHRASEGARDGLRYAIVSSPVSDVDGDGMADLPLVCPGPAIVVPACTSDVCQPLLQRVQRVAPDVRGSQVSVTYACSDAGNPERPAEILIPEITVRLTGLVYTFAVPGIIGLGTTLNLPDVTITRTGEDLYTSAGS